MPGEPQPLFSEYPIVYQDGRPTDYFIRWAQQRQIDISSGITAAEAQELIDDWAAARQIIAGVGLSGGGFLSSDVTIDLENTAVVPGAYTNTNLTVDAQGRITAAANGSGGGGGASKTGIVSGSGTLVASPVPTGSFSFGPFATAAFDGAAVVTPTAGHVYRVDVNFTVYTATGGGGGNILMAQTDKAKGYFAGHAGTNPGSSNQQLYSVNGASFTSLRLGIAESGSSGGQTYQFFLYYIGASNNVIWSRSFSGLAGATAPNAVANFATGFVLGYSGTAGDTFTMEVYDMGTLAQFSESP